MSQGVIIGVVVLMMMSSSVGAVALMMGGSPEAGTVCTPEGTKDANATYKYDAQGKCAMTCNTGYKNTNGACVRSEYKYEFIKNIESSHAENFNVHITDIRVDGTRVTSDQIQLHEEPEWAKCNSKDGGYECEGDNYGLNDPEPASPQFIDMTWSAWKEGQIPVGSKVMTITTSSKVKEFEIDYFRPKYAPGWIIKENGKEVLKETANGGSENTPNPKTIKYTIP
jgi:hypothetical protein